MTNSRRRALRQTWFQVHKWIGLALAILLVPLSLSGSLLVWHDTLDHAINPARYAVSGHGRLPAERYVAAAQAILGGDEKIASLDLAPRGGPVVVVAADPPSGQRRPGPPPRTSVWLNPADARVLDVAASNSGAMRWIHMLHGSLLIPGIGRSIVGVLGIAMFLSAATGLWLWWPLSGRFTRGLRWKRRAEVSANLHHQMGFWVCLPLAMLALTGALIAFPALLPGGSGQASRGGAGQRTMPVAARLSPSAVLAAAAPLVSAAPKSLTWPTDAEPAWRVSGGPGRDVAVDDGDGRVTSVAPRPRGGSSAMRLVRQLHEGEGLGPVWQTIIVVSGFVPGVLAVTGILMWLAVRRRRGARGCT